MCSLIKYVCNIFKGDTLIKEELIEKKEDKKDKAIVQYAFVYIRPNNYFHICCNDYRKYKWSVVYQDPARLYGYEAIL